MWTERGRLDLTGNCDLTATENQTVFKKVFIICYIWVQNKRLFAEIQNIVMNKQGCTS
jgi:hypothetical protein